MTVKILDKRAPEALLMPLLQSEQLAERLSEVANRTGIDAAALQQDFRAEAREILPIYSPGHPGRRLYLIGLGKKARHQDIQAAMRSFCHRYKSKLPLRVGIDLRHFLPSDIPRLTDGAVYGMLLGLYNIGLYRKDNTPEPLFGNEKSTLEIMAPTADIAVAEAAARRGECFARAAVQVFDLMNAPGNKKTPEVLAAKAVEAGREAGFSVRILFKEDIIAKGLEALWSVGKGSPHPPALILLEYGKKTRKIQTPCFGLVGKGVTFDTGGISIKPSANMHFMKSDMGGAAAVLGTFMVAAGLELPVRLVGAIPVAENMVDGLAIKPGDVIGSYSGKTIEVTDTDAEGRLILADAIAYLVKQEKPDVLIDLATLTGSIIRAIGNHAAGLFTQNDALAAALCEAGDGCGERLWRMPMWEEYGADLKSDVADLRNFTGKPMAECISAAKFIEHFTAEHPAWAHLDIAGVAFGDSEFAQTKSATGYGVRLLVEFMERWTTG